MAFKLLIIYLAMAFLRPIEQFAPDLMAMRPVLILGGLTFVAGIASSRKSGLFGAHPVHIRLLAAFCLIIVISLVVNGIAYAIPEAAGRMSTSAMFMLLMALNVTSIERLKAICITLVVCVLLLCLQAMHSYYTGFMLDTFVIRQLAQEDVPIPPGLNLPSDDVTGIYLWRLRSVGFLQDPNDFSQVICMVLPWLFLWYRKGAWFSNAVKIGVPASIMLYSIQLSHSRGGLIGVAMLGFVQLIRKVGAWWGFAIGAVGGGLAQIAIQMGGRAFSAKEASANERLDAWFAGLEMFKSSPLFGVGFGQFAEHHIRTAHNSFVLCFAEVGSLGYFCWLAMIVLAFQGVVYVAKHENKEVNWIGWMMCSSLSSYLACAWFLSRSYEASLFMLLGLCFATYCAVARGQTRKPQLVQQFPLAAPWVKTTFMLYALSLIGVSAFVRAAG